MNRALRSCIVFSLISLAVGGISALVSGGFAPVYGELILPSFAPPGYVFPIVWTVLYILMGVGAGLVYVSPSSKRDEAITWYVLQLAVNFLWPVIFFSQRWYLFAFLWLCLLLWLVFRMTQKFFRVRQTAAFLQLPYIVWLLFAALLNLSVVFLN